MNMQDPASLSPGAMPSPATNPELESPQEDRVEQSPIGTLASYLEQVNIASKLTDEELAKIGLDAYDGYKTDLESRKHWEENLDNWTKLALQVKEEKTYPWPKASNVKFPLLATAAMQFNARSYPTLVPADGKLVHTEVVGKDPQGQKKLRADRISSFMSYQLMKQMEGWDEQMDKLLLILPIVGTCFKKTYWDSIKKVNCSRLIMPKDLVVNYWATSLEDTERKTEKIQMTQRILKERVMANIFLDVDLSAPTATDSLKAFSENKGNIQSTTPGKDDKSTPYVILEQHTFLDLDDDGYDEPYIVTIEERSRKVLRIVARFDDKSIFTDDEGNLVKIEPTEYYTKYSFIPNPDGGFYDIGFGLLLGPLNESVNTIVNQLVDAGTLSNLQCGFIGKGLRLKIGQTGFSPGEFKVVNATGDDIKKQIYMIPPQQPSATLFQLLELLVTATKELASVAEIFVGKMPGQNTPATTTQETVKQGMMLFTAVYKRVYRSLTKEFKKLFRLNRVYLDPKEETNVLDDQIGQEDFEDKSYDVCPAADPSATSSQEKSVKAQMLLSLLQLGTVDPMAVTLRILEAQEQAKPEELLPKGPPPPDPKVAAAQEESKAKVAVMQEQAQLKAVEMQQKMAIEAQHAQMEQRSKEFELAMKAQMAQQEHQQKAAMGALELRLKELDGILAVKTATQVHDQKMAHADAEHKMKIKAQAEKATKSSSSTPTSINVTVPTKTVKRGKAVKQSDGSYMLESTSTPVKD